MPCQRTSFRIASRNIDCGQDVTRDLATEMTDFGHLYTKGSHRKPRGHAGRHEYKPGMEGRTPNAQDLTRQMEEGPSQQRYYVTSTSEMAETKSSTAFGTHRRTPNSKRMCEASQKKLRKRKHQNIMPTRKQGPTRCLLSMVKVAIAPPAAQILKES